MGDAEISFVGGKTQQAVLSIQFFSPEPCSMANTASTYRIIPGAVTRYDTTITPVSTYPRIPVTYFYNVGATGFSLGDIITIQNITTAPYTKFRYQLLSAVSNAKIQVEGDSGDVIVAGNVKFEGMSGQIPPLVGNVVNTLRFACSRGGSNFPTGLTIDIIFSDRKF